MKAVILAGGLGSRLSEETVLKPKPLVEVGGKPIIWHIMKIYAQFGITEFVLCLGYKGYAIKEYFANYFRHNSDMVVNVGTGSLEVINRTEENWKVWMIDTGEHTLTGGRIKRVLEYVDGDEFCMTYGDGVANIDIGALLAHHRQQKKLATVTAVRMPGRFGSLDIEGEMVTDFVEKPHGDSGWINGGFFVLSPKVGKYISGDETTWEQEPMRQLAEDGEMSAYSHDGFWQPMDTIRDRESLNSLWASGNAPWKIWT